MEAKKESSQGMLYPYVNCHNRLSTLKFVTMKQQTTTTANQPQATFVCSTLLYNLLNDDSSRFDLTWDSRKCRESSFALFEDRCRAVEYRLSLVNTLCMDYHLHRPEEVAGTDEDFRIYVCDENPKESEALLMQAKEIIELTLEHIFIPDRPVHTGYALLAMSLLYKIYAELEQFGKHFRPMQELKHLLVRSTRM